jgi:hypothetical protein
MLRFLLAPIVATTILAADKTGKYQIGGGVGGLGCPVFLNIMATARQAGGLNSVAGTEHVASLENYVLGFETGANAEPNGIVDIFSALGNEPADSALYAIEPWCAEQPDKRFGEGVIELAKKLRGSAKRLGKNFLGRLGGILVRFER